MTQLSTFPPPAAEPRPAPRQIRSQDREPAYRPRFARHARHVAAVLAEGGFPAVGP